MHDGSWVETTVGNIPFMRFGCIGLGVTTWMSNFVHAQRSFAVLPCRLSVIARRHHALIRTWFHDKWSNQKEPNHRRKNDRIKPRHKDPSLVFSISLCLCVL